MRSNCRASRGKGEGQLALNGVKKLYWQIYENNQGRLAVVIQFEVIYLLFSGFVNDH
jgi:hypothetical protein